MKRKVIIVTDGDKIAKQAVETATTNIGGRCISATSGNPTPVAGYDIVRLIKSAKYDPVVIMVDDRGHTGFGLGEKALSYVVHHCDIEVLGVVAVASNTPKTRGVKVNFSVDKHGNICDKAVDKHGNVQGSRILKGDTVNSLADMNVPVIVGVGDPGKMEGWDTKEIGAPILTIALKKILEFHKEKNNKTCE